MKIESIISGFGVTCFSGGISTLCDSVEISSFLIIVGYLHISYYSAVDLHHTVIYGSLLSLE